MTINPYLFSIFYKKKYPLNLKCLTEHHEFELPF